ncbi:hypothetical protein [Pectobacterium polaris]|uniref:hypothetical protein n=1 Tax=Pectobacterium polaris TaxID=2042057 RepID=UPI0021C985D1|nr:hypothetical protein [Pectobacterium polaris]MCU1791620.1 hypothetical protein [Pectobacterium polaris]
MEIFRKLENIVELYFNQQYCFYKSKDANNLEIKKNFIFDSRAHFLEAYLDYYRNLSNLDSAITDGCNAKFKISFNEKEYELKHTHQEEFEDNDGNTRGVNNIILLEMADKLAKKNNHLKLANSFDDVYKTVKSSKVRGFGELSIYDTAVRISTYLRFKPEQVFLHAGAREGVNYLEMKGILPTGSSRKETLRVGEFPEPLQKLDTVQLENFLCSFKNDINKI